MASRSLNKVQLIGNLTRDPNLRYTPNSTAVCSFGLATNRTWSGDDGERQERVDFHNIVAWSKLADICGQLLHKGDKVYVEGRLQTREWKDDQENTRRITEVVIDNMILLRSSSNSPMSDGDAPASAPKKKSTKKSDPAPDPEPEEVTEAEDIADDIPF